MEQPLFASANVKQSGNSLAVVHGEDHGLIVTFYMESVLQGAESSKAGRPIYKDEPYIWIRFPGDKTREVKRRVDMAGRRGLPDQVRFPRQWAAFQNQHEAVHEGTPLEEWPPISKSVALNLKGVNVHTVEHLAAVPDTTLHNLGHGGRQLRDKAIAWLKSAEGSAELLALKSENQTLKDDMEIMKQQIAALGAKKTLKLKK